MVLRQGGHPFGSREDGNGGVRNQYAASLVDHGVMRLADHGDVKEVDTVAASAAEDMDTWLIGEREGK